MPDAWERWLDAPSGDQATNDALAEEIAGGTNAAARLRAYLDARYRMTDMPDWIDGAPGVALLTADLEVVLQMNLLLAQLLRTGR